MTWFTQYFALELKFSSSIPTSRWSKANLRPSFVTLSILSSDGSTPPSRMRAALLAKPSTYFFCSSEASMEIVSITAFGTSISLISLTLISATSLKIVNNSANPTNRVNLVLARYPVPSGASSMAVFVSPNVDAQLSNESMPSSFKVFNCK